MKRVDAADVKRTVSLLGLLPPGAPVKRHMGGWLTLCLFHEDSHPSMSIFVGDDGFWRFHCFSCGASGTNIDFVMRTESVDFRAALMLLGAADVKRAAARPPAEPTPRPVPRAIEPTSVPATERVVRWLREVRKLSGAEAAAMHSSRGGNAVAFRYAQGDGQLVYEKFRSLVGKDFWRKPSGSPSLLYGLDRVPGAGRIVIVEGELDVHALRSAGLTCAVSVPDGAGSSVRPELLAPLAAFDLVLIATDRDEAGHALAERLAAALGRGRCRRVTFGPWKDANDALRAGWSAREFEAAFAAAKDFPLREEGATQDPMRSTPKGPKTATGHRGSASAGLNARGGRGPRAEDGPAGSTEGRTSRAGVGHLPGLKGAGAAPPRSGERASGVRPSETREALPSKALAPPAHDRPVMNGGSGAGVSQATTIPASRLG